MSELVDDEEHDDPMYSQQGYCTGTCARCLEDDYYADLSMYGDS